MKPVLARIFAKAVKDGSLYKSRGFNISKFMSFVDRDSCAMGMVPLQKFLQSTRRRQGKGDLSEMRLAEETLFLAYFGWVAPNGKPWAGQMAKVSRILTDTGIQEHVYRRLIHPK